MRQVSERVTTPRRTTWWAVLRPILRVDLLASAKAIEDTAPARTAGQISFRLALPGDFAHLASLAEAEGRGIPDFPPRVPLAAEFERRHRKRDVCLLASAYGHIAYFSWMCFDAWRAASASRGDGARRQGEIVTATPRWSESASEKVMNSRAVRSGDTKM